MLYELAGDTAPQQPEGTAEDKKKRRDAWAAWWKLNVKRVDFSRLSLGSCLGLHSHLRQHAKRVYEIDQRRQSTLVHRQLKESSRCHRAARPAQFIIADNGARRVTERDFKGNILWQKEVDDLVNVQALTQRPHLHRQFRRGYYGSGSKRKRDLFDFAQYSRYAAWGLSRHAAKSCA